MKAFCLKTGLSRDTVNFYIRLGLIVPSSNGSATNAYRDFDEHQVETAWMIGLAKALGFSLAEIGRMAKQYRTARLDRAEQILLLQGQLDRLAERRTALEAMDAALREKLDRLRAEDAGSAAA